MSAFIHAPFSGRGGGWTPNPFQSYSFPSSSDEEGTYEENDRYDMGCGIEIPGPLDNGHYLPECTLQECFCGVKEEEEEEEEEMNKMCSIFLDFWKSIEEDQ